MEKAKNIFMFINYPIICNLQYIMRKKPLILGTKLHKNFSQKASNALLVYTIHLVLKFN